MRSWTHTSFHWGFQEKHYLCSHTCLWTTGKTLQKSCSKLFRGFSCFNASNGCFICETLWSTFFKALCCAQLCSIISFHYHFLTVYFCPLSDSNKRNIFTESLLLMSAGFKAKHFSCNVCILLSNFRKPILKFWNWFMLTRKQMALRHKSIILLKRTLKILMFFFFFFSYFPDGFFLLKGNLRRSGSNFTAFPWQFQVIAWFLVASQFYTSQLDSGFYQFATDY